MQQVSPSATEHEKAATPKGRRKSQWRKLSIWVAARPIQQWPSKDTGNAVFRNGIVVADAALQQTPLDKRGFASAIGGGSVYYRWLLLIGHGGASYYLDANLGEGRISVSMIDRRAHATVAGRQPGNAQCPMAEIIDRICPESVTIESHQPQLWGLRS